MGLRDGLRLQMSMTGERRSKKYHYIFDDHKVVVGLAG